jgi:hypothetical protein
LGGSKCDSIATSKNLSPKHKLENNTNLLCAKRNLHKTPKKLAKQKTPY